jgi:hypothetical protein
MSSRTDWTDALPLAPGEVLGEGGSDSVSQEPTAEGGVLEALSALALLFAANELAVQELPTAQAAGLDLAQVGPPGTFVVDADTDVVDADPRVERFIDDAENTWLRVGKDGVVRMSRAGQDFLVRLGLDTVDHAPVERTVAEPLALPSPPDLIALMPEGAALEPWLVREVRQLASLSSPLGRLASIGLLLRMLSFQPSTRMSRTVEDFQRSQAWVDSARAWLQEHVTDELAEELERVALARVDRVASRLFEEEVPSIDTLRTSAMDRDELESVRWAVRLTRRTWKLEVALQQLDAQCLDAPEAWPVVFELGDPFHDQARYVRIHNPEHWWGRLARIA